MYKLMCRNKEVLEYNTLLNTIEVIDENLLHPGFGPRDIKSFKTFLEIRDTSNRVSDIDHYWLKDASSKITYEMVQIPRREFIISETEKEIIKYLNWEHCEQLDIDTNLFRNADISNSYMNDPVYQNIEVLNILDYVLGTNIFSEENTGALYDSSTGRFISGSPLCWRYSGINKHPVTNNYKYEKILVINDKILTNETYINRINKLGINSISASKFASTINNSDVVAFEKEQRNKYPSDLLNAMYQYLERR